MAQANLDSQVIAQIDLSIHLIQQSEEFAHYEIDSIPGILGDLYRVWGGERGINLLGTFYQSRAGNWIAQKSNASQCSCWLTDAEATAHLSLHKSKTSHHQWAQVAPISKCCQKPQP